MPGGRQAGALGNRSPLAAATIVEVGAAAGAGLDQAQLNRKSLKQRSQGTGDLATQKPAEERICPQLGRHPRYPDSLPGGVQVDIVASLALSASIVIESIGWGPKTATWPEELIAKSLGAAPLCQRFGTDHGRACSKRAATPPIVSIP